MGEERTIGAVKRYCKLFALRGICKTHVTHKIALWAPFFVAPPRLPIRAWSRL
jgi:hypothetical protein